MAFNVGEFLESILDFGQIVDSVIGDAFSDVLVKIYGDQDDDGTDEEIEEQSLFQHAAILHRPADPTDDGEMEGIFWRRGDELIVLSTRDRRWQVSIDKGEVILRCYRDPAEGTVPMVRLSPDGTAYILAPQVRIEETKDGTVQSMAWGDAIQTWADNVKSWADAHIHPAGLLVDSMSGACTGTTGAPSSGSPSPGTLKSSKHKVE